MAGMQDIIWLLDIGRYICKILIAEMYVGKFLLSTWSFEFEDTQDISAHFFLFINWQFTVITMIIK